MMEISTIHWLPEHIAHMREFQEIAKANDYLLRRTLVDLERVFNNQFLERLDEDGCAMHEAILGIIPGVRDNLDDRRRRIRGYYASDLPYTENKLNAVLAVMCGTHNFDLEVDGAAYQITVRVIDRDILLARNIHRVVSFMKPANILLKLYEVYRGSVQQDVCSQVAAVRFRTEFYPMFNLPELCLDGSWELDGSQSLDGYYGGDTIDLNPVSMAVQVPVRVDTGTDCQMRIQCGTEVAPETGVAVRMSGKSEHETGTEARTRMSFSVEHRTFTGTVMHKENDLDDGWMLDGTRCLDGGDYPL